MKKKTTSRRTRTATVKPAAPLAKLPAHYTADYIINPAHPVTINLIGCGGTGSQVLNSLARMNSALKALGHTGLFVRAIDPDKVTEANMGRQLFSPSDVGEHKCVSLIGRINRFFGNDWEAVPLRYNERAEISSANITISCVDTGEARKGIKSTLIEKAVKYQPVHTDEAYFRFRNREPYQVPYYWMDFGNMRDRGQVVVGTLREIKQPAKAEFDGRKTLPLIDKLHPDILKDKKGDDQGPSCSLAEALHKQDLFINTNLANMGMALLWKMFTELHIKYHGCYLNLANMTLNPIAVR